MIRQMIRSTGTDPRMAQPHNDQGSFDADCLDNVPEEESQQHDNSRNRVSSFVAATEASIRFSAVLPTCGSAIPHSSQLVPFHNSDSNYYYITNITNVENIGLVDGTMCVEGMMSLGG